MKSVLISIRPEWCELIASGKKTLEVRKTRPRLDVPFKVYIYCTKDQKRKFWCSKTYTYVDDRSHNCFDKCGNGMAIGEFICDDCSLLSKAHYGYIEQFAHITREALNTYMGLEAGRELSCDDGCWGWHISDLKIYDRPKDLCDFRKPFPFHSFCKICARGGTGFHSETCYGCDHFENINITRPPQSWCYVEEIIYDSKT
ncbi:MAG: ASCH domain-containing protein [Faecousia sp.]